jgi:hypothetical protein
MYTISEWYYLADPEKQYTSIQCCGSGSESGPLWSDPDPDPDPDVSELIRINFLVKKILQEYLFLHFLSHDLLFRAYFSQNNFQKKLSWKYIRVRIRTFSKVGSGSGQKS